jgi:Uncharacterised protein conserved in bacteria (DUF2336)
MTTSPLFPGFDGLMTLSRREGVDIRPTLLRVLTDLYVQANAHSGEEERQFVELTSRLIDQVDDATRAAVRARLAIYPGTPIEVLSKLGLEPVSPNQPIPLAREIPAAPAPAPPPVKPLTEAQLRMASNLSMQPKDAAEINDMFFGANSSERALILHNLEETPLKAAARIPPFFAARAVETLEMAAFAADIENFTHELRETLILPAKVAAQVVADPGGEPLACAAKALGMPANVFQRVLIFLPAFGQSVTSVYRLSRLYDRLSERSALVMLAAWRGSTMAATRAKYRPALYDDERHRARAAPGLTRPAVQPGVAFGTRNTSRASGS